jgi:hypothetical protein
MPDTQGHVDMVVGQTDLPVGERQAQVDLGLLLKEFQRDGKQMALAEGDGCGHVQPATQRAIVAGGLPLRRVHFVQDAT